MSQIFSEAQTYNFSKIIIECGDLNTCPSTIGDSKNKVLSFLCQNHTDIFANNMGSFRNEKLGSHLSLGLFACLFKQVRPNDVWTCVACNYLIYKKLT